MDKKRHTSEKLNERQLRFCQEYVVDFNATQAAIRAGYSKNGVESTASTLLRVPKVQDEIDRLKGRLQLRTEKSQSDIIAELEYIAFSRITDVVKVQTNGLPGGNVVFVSDSNEWTNGTKAAIESIAETKDGIRIKMHGKLKALELLMQYHGMLKDNDAEPEQDATPIKVTLVKNG